jgi:hypothetical protein
MSDKVTRIVKREYPGIVPIVSFGPTAAADRYGLWHEISHRRAEWFGSIESAFRAVYHRLPVERTYE